MDSDPKSPTPTPQPLLPNQPDNNALTVAPHSPWEAFLTGKKAPADRFLTKMGTGAITVPDSTTRVRFAETIANKPARIARLIELLRASTASSDTIRRIVDGLAAASITRLSGVSFPEPLDSDIFRDVIACWVSSISKKPLKSVEMNTLFLLLHFGRHRQLLEHDTAVSLVASAVTRSVTPRANKAQPTGGKRAKSKPKRTQPAKPDPTPLEVILTAGRSGPVLSSLVAFHRALKKDTDRLKAQIQAQSEDIARLRTEATRLQDTIFVLQGDLANLQKEKAASDGKVADIERQFIELRDGYQHKLDELRGRMRGVLQGQLARWLETALDAARSDPPWAQAIQERLEDALKLIEKEIQWLQPSA
jgi:hypothetical protein